MNAGLRRGRDAEIANMQAIADLGVTKSTSAVIATRGERLALSRDRFSGRDQRPEAFHTEALGIVEIDADERIVARVSFDPDDIDAAFEDSMPATSPAKRPPTRTHGRSSPRPTPRSTGASSPDDAGLGEHRPPARDSFRARRHDPYIRAAWDVAPDINIHIEAVHRLSNLGAVVTHTANGTSQEGFDAEWRESPHDGRRRPDQPLRDVRRGRPRRRARQVRRAQPAGAAAGKRGKPSDRRFQACFAARDWDAMAEAWPTTIPGTIADGS